MTTPTGVNDDNTNDIGLNDATDLFLNRWKDAEDQPSNTDEGETPEPEDTATTLDTSGDDNASDTDDEELDLDEDDNATESNEDQPSETAALEATDDHKVTVTVDGETKTVTVKELKRLFGQEASLTRKSQEVAATKKEAEAHAERYMVAAQKLIDKAQSRYQPFEKIDWLVAQQRLSADEFAALRNEAREAHADLTFLQTEADDVLGQVKTERQAQIAEAAKESIKVLEATIPGWNQEVYNRVRTFAISEGMEAEAVNTIIDPSVLKILHSAMRYSELKAKASDKKLKQKGAAKRVMKPATNVSTKIGQQGGKTADALTQLGKTGTRDDAANAFLAGWAEDRD